MMDKIRGKSILEGGQKIAINASELRSTQKCAENLQEWPKTVLWVEGPHHTGLHNLKENVQVASVNPHPQSGSLAGGNHKTQGSTLFYYV